MIINTLRQKLLDDISVFLSENKNKYGADEINLQNIMLGEPKNKDFGDLTTNAAMVLAPTFRQKPMEIAKMLVDDMLSKWEIFAEISVAAPGFINLAFSESFIRNKLGEIPSGGSGYGRNESGKGIKIQIEFVSANPTGNLHIGHGRWGSLGDSLSNIYDANGYDVCREYYVNDFGAQIRNFASCLGCLYLRKIGREVPYPEDGYPEELVKTLADEIFAAKGEKFLIKSDNPSESQPRVDITLIGREGINIMISRIKNTINSMGVEFDEWFRESTLYENSNFDRTMSDLKQKEIVYEKDGALWFKASQFGDDKDRVVIRSDGEPTYFASDILYLLNKVRRGFSQLIYILGADHHGYIKRLHAIGKAVGFDDNNISVIIGQLVRLVKKGEAVRMSKRKGKFYNLDDLIKEVGRDAVRYFFSMNSFDTPMDFDIDLAKQKSSQNPVYYVQYAHARISSIIEKVKSGKSINTEIKSYLEISGDTINGIVFKNKEEIELVKTLIFYPDVILDACRNDAPHFVTQYLYRLASQFHYFYNHYRIIDESNLGVENNLDIDRLRLVLLVKTVLENALKILGVSAPDKM
ncbi:MAG: arginine--tRNA ligase [Actinobacteria bacterium]|nr:arginine--tRNA ligase [Actinomycetota bacterium]